MAELKVVGEILADNALRLTDQLVQDSRLPGITDDDGAEAAIRKITTQDKPRWSKRVWAAALQGLTALLLLAVLNPETQEVVTAWIVANTGPYAPALVPIAGGLLALLSKALDPRPER